MTGTEVERLVVRLIGDPEAYIRALNKAMLETRTFVQKVQGFVAQVGPLVFATAAAGITAFFKKSIDSASNAQETMSKFEIVFGNQAKAVENFAETLSKEVNRGKMQLVGYLSGFQDLFVPLGFAADEAESMSKQLTKLTLDLASFNNMAESQVYDNLQAAMTGSGEVMKKYGVIVSETTVKQEALNMGLNPKNLTEVQKAQARLNIIMKGTTAAQGDAARTSGGYANMTRGLAAAMEELQITIGEQLLPTITAIVGGFSAMLKTMAELFNGMESNTKSLIINLGSLIVIIKGVQAAFALMGIRIGGVSAALNLLTAHPIIAIGVALATLVMYLRQAKEGTEGIEQAYREAGIEIGKMTGKVTILNEELLKSNRMAKEQAVGGIDAEIAKHRKNLLEAKRDLAKHLKDPDANTNYGKGTTAMYQDNIARAEAALAKLEASKQEIEGKFTGGDKLAGTGISMTKGFLDNMVDKAEKLKPKLGKFLEPAIEAQKKLNALVEEQMAVYEGMAGKASQILMDNLTPIERLKTEIDDIQKLIDVGMLTEAAGKQAMDRLVGQFASQGGTTQHTGGAAIQRGSVEAYSLTNFGTHQRTTEKGVWDLVGQTKVSVATQKEILAALRKDHHLPVKITIPGS